MKLPISPESRGQAAGRSGERRPRAVEQRRPAACPRDPGNTKKRSSFPLGIDIIYYLGISVPTGLTFLLSSLSLRRFGKGFKAPGNNFFANRLLRGSASINTRFTYG